MKSLAKDQRGLASIIVTVFILIMLSLIVLAFSQITRREQRQSLDRQLSNQAFYAAESGVNVATKFIRSDTPVTKLDRSDCNDPAPTSLNPDNARLDSAPVAADSNFKFPCVLFDRAPPTIDYSSVDTQGGEFVSMKTLGNDLSSLTITWSDTDGGNTFSGCPSVANATFPKKSGYTNCDAGMIRVLLMPFTNGISRQQLTDASYTVYLRPVQPGATGLTSFANHGSGSGPNRQGDIVAAKCEPATTKCSATIDGVPGGAGLYMHIKSIYNPSIVSIAGFSGTGPVRFTEAQAKIDSTGKVADVLKRIQVRIPLLQNQEIPGYVVQSMSGICKQLDVYPSDGLNPGSADYSSCGGLGP